MKTPSNRILSRSFIVIAALAALPAHATNGTWNQTGALNLNWNTNANWSNGTFPNAAADTATLNTALVGTESITLGQNITVGGLTLGATTNFSYLLVGGSQLIMNNNGAGATILENSTVSGNLDNVGTPIVIADTGGLAIKNSSASGLKISGNITSTASTPNLVIQANSTGSISFTASINNAGSITNSGSGSGTVSITNTIGTNITGITQNSATSALLISSNNTTYTGPVVVQTGTLILNAQPSAAGTGTITLGNASTPSTGATILIGQVNETQTIMLGTGASSNGNNPVLEIANFGTATPTTGNAIQLNGNNVTIASIGTTGGLNISGGVTGTGNVIFNEASASGGSTLSSNAANNAGTITNTGTSTGATTISGGIGSNVTAVTESSATSALTLSGTITVNSGSLTLNESAGGAKLGVASVVTGTGNLVLNNNSTAGNLTLTTGGVNITGTVTNSGSGTGSTTITGVIGTNVLNVNQNSAGSTLILSGANTYTGSTTVSSGTLQAGVSSVANVSGAFGNNSAVTLANTAGATLFLNGNATQVGSLSGGGTTGGNVLEGSGRLTIGGSNINTTYSGVIGGTGGITAAFTGTQVLAGTNTYTGSTQVIQGALVAGSNVPSGAAGAFGNATSALLLGSATSTFTGAAAILTSGTYTVARAITETATPTSSSMSIGGIQSTGTSTYTGTITMTGATTLTSAIGGTVNFNDVIVGAQNVTIGGGGTVMLTGTNTFSGGTITVQGGSTLNASNLTNNGNLGASTNNLVFNNGTFQFSPSTFLDLSTRSTTFNGVGATIDTNGTTGTFTNAVGNNGTGGLALSDSATTAGTLTLAAANTYTGTTTVTRGTLVTTGVGTLGGSSAGVTSALAVNTNGNLDLHSTSQTVGNLTGTGGKIFNNGVGTSTLTIGNGSTTANGGGSYAGVIQDNNGSGGQMALTKTGTGTIGLTGASTYTGATTISAGVLNIGGAGSLGGTAVTVTGGTLGIGSNGSSATTVIGTSGVGSLNLNGGTLNFSNGINNSADSAIKTLDINSSTGGTALTLNGGTISVGIGGAGGSDQIVLGTGVSLVTSLSGTTTINLNIVSALDGTSQELIAYGTGGVVGSGIYQLGNVTGNTGGYSLTLVANSTGLFLNESAVSFAYWKGGSGTSWANVANFTTDVGGTTTRSDALDNQTTVTFIATGGANYANTTLDGSPTINNLVYNVGGVGIGNGSGTNSLTIAGATGILVNSGLGAVTETISANVALGGSQTWTVSDAASTLAVSGNISGTGFSLLKAGNGTLILSGANSYSGSTSVLAGYLNIQNSDALDGTTGVTVSNNAALQLQGGVTTNNNTALTINGTGPGTAGALESTTDLNSYTGAINLGSASSIGSDTGLFSVTGPTITNNGFTLTLVGAGNGYISGIIGGSGGLTMSGTGTWSLDGVNIYTGTTTINSGVLQVGTSTTTPANPPTLGASSNALVMNGGTLDIDGYNVSIGNLTGSSGTITNSYPAEVTLTLNTTANSSFGGTITNGDAGAGIIDLLKNGSGTQTLTGSNSYTGSTTITAGALNIAGSNALSANTTVTVVSGAALQLSGGITTSAVPLSLVGTGVTGGALENVSGNNTYTGSITLAGNTSIGSDAGSLTLSTGGLALGGSNLTLVGASTGTISDTITGTGALAMAGTGTWTLSGSNAYTGTTSVTAGTLVYTKGSALRNSAAISLGATGSTTLNYAGAGATMTTPMNFSGTGTVTLGNIGTGSITYSGPLTFANANTTIALGNTTDTIGGTIGNIANGGSSTTSLVKQGAMNSTWVLTGSNTYTGATTITGGVLQVASTAAIPPGNLNINGTTSASPAILQTSGTLTMNLGSGAGQLQWGGNAGFSAIGGNLVLNITSSGTLVPLAWGSNFTGNGGTMIAFGSSTSNALTILNNNINLNTGDAFQQGVYVAKGAGGDATVFQGYLTNGTGTTASSGLEKFGAGTLILTNSNSSYSGVTSVIGGTLVAEASSFVTATNSTSTTTGVFGSGYGTVGNATPTAANAIIYLGNGLGSGSNGAGGVINPTLLAGSPTVGGSTTIANQINVDWTNGTGQVYGIGGYTDSNNTFSGQILLNGTPATGNTFAITQVATTGTDALNITGGITSSNAVTGTVNFNNVGAVNVSTTGISNGSGASVISVTQGGTGTTTFSAANTYTGPTTVNAGLLRINGSLASGSAVTVNTGGALGGTGTISGAVSINSGGAINLADGTIGTLTVGSLTLGTGSTAMSFDIGAGASNNLDSIANLGALTVNGTSAITIGFVSGSPLLTAGTYSLISGPITGTQFSDLSLTDSTLGSYAFSLVNGGAAGLELMVTSNLAPSTYFYTGSTSTDFTDYHNFNTGASNGTVQTAGLSSTSDVTIGTTSPTPSNLTPVANSNISINSLTFASSGSGATLSGTGTVTIAAGSGTGITDSTGISTGTETISTALALGANQSWSTSANSTLRVTGAISGSQSLALTGAGTYRIGGANTFSGLTVGTGSDTPTVYLANGTNGSATGTTTFTVKAGATIGGKGTSSGTSFNIAGTGTATAARANVLVGLTSLTDTNTTGVLTLKGSTGTSVIADTALTFNLDAAGTTSTQLNVGNTLVAFGTDSAGSVKLNLNMQNEPAIVANNSMYTLIAGTGSTSITPGSSTGQYTGLTLGTTTNMPGGVTETKITGNNLQLAFGSPVDSSYYANGSYLVLYQSVGVDDIDVVVVPEPGTWAMMLGGLAALLFWQRRRSKS